MQSFPTPHVSSFMAWLDSLSDWRFTGTLYLIRWAIVVPLSLLLSPLATSADAFQADGNPWAYLIPFLVVAPALETLAECSLPYWLMYRVLKLRRQSDWPFVVVAATIMVLLHPLTPVVVVMAFITGAFLGYVYAHFARYSQGKAFLHTATFHAAINAVGWVMLLLNATA
jgi:hypothetical protein